MHRTAVLCTILAIGFTTFAQTVELTGKVTNQGGKPIADATVTLSSLKLSVTTDASGVYKFSTASPVTESQFIPSAEKISLYNGIVSMDLIKAVPVKIEMFDVKGTLLARVLDQPATAGSYQFNLLNHPHAANMTVIRVSVGNRISTFRYLPLHNGRQSFSTAKVSTQNSRGLAKMQASVDVLKVSAKGYALKETPVASYSGSVDVMLDTISLAYFSFFVTSLEAMQSLSGSQNGFGGDLRFGKTGPGAGLLGADSICQCIAERSMPGSKVKQWRAFLSVKQGPDGTQVNAADRIGQGPWYDRLGRLISPTLKDLLHSRPSNGDETIKDDLPNENGIPNHQPDPNQEIVDNHLTITGSDSLGRLFGDNGTCDDWTSTTSSDQPRAGLSWPREMGGFGGFGDFTGGGGFTGFGKKQSDVTAFTFDTTGGFGGGFGDFGDFGNFATMNNDHWISSWSLSGCEAGIDLDESTMAGVAGVKTIGNGGGYGGFYCFALNP